MEAELAWKTSRANIDEHNHAPVIWLRGILFRITLSTVVRCCCRFFTINRPLEPRFFHRLSTTVFTNFHPLFQIIYPPWIALERTGVPPNVLDEGLRMAYREVGVMDTDHGDPPGGWRGRRFAPLRDRPVWTGTRYGGLCVQRKRWDSSGKRRGPMMTSCKPYGSASVGRGDRRGWPGRAAAGPNPSDSSLAGQRPPAAQSARTVRPGGLP